MQTLQECPCPQLLPLLSAERLKHPGRGCKRLYSSCFHLAGASDCCLQQQLELGWCTGKGRQRQLPPSRRRTHQGLKLGQQA